MGGWVDRQLSFCRHTASIGFSVANFDILAISSLRFSGGNMLSSHDDPLLRTPVAVPWRAPVIPLTAAAMIVDACAASFVIFWGF